MTFHLQGVKRPKILINAEKLGLETYNRSTCLESFLALSINQQPAQILQSLIDKEGQLNQMRLQQHVQYNNFLHVTVLTALNAETIEIEITEKQPIQTKLSGISDLRFTTNASRACFTAMSISGSR
mgnify:CR=1 FL=1